MAEKSLIHNLAYNFADTCFYTGAAFAALNLNRPDQSGLPEPAQVLLPVVVAGAGILIYCVNMAYDFVKDFSRSVKLSGLERILEPTNK